jgi:hypothetical protein
MNKVNLRLEPREILWAAVNVLRQVQDWLDFEEDESNEAAAKALLAELKRMQKLYRQHQNAEAEMDAAVEEDT